MRAVCLFALFGGPNSPDLVLDWTWGSFNLIRIGLGDLVRVTANPRAGVKNRLPVAKPFKAGTKP